MSYFVTKYPQGTFCWADVSSTNVDKTINFMKELMGWTSVAMPMGDGMDYTMFYLDGKEVAAAAPMMPDMVKNGVPSSWSNYIKVDDVDVITKKAEELGAKIVMPVMDVFDSGRMSMIADPTGAVVGLWQPQNHIGARVVNKVGAMGWNELYTNDKQKSKEFYTKLFGWTYKAGDQDEGYTTILNNGRMNGGMMKITPEMKGMPPKWMTYFTVQNADETAKRVEELGGKVWMVKAIEVGKIVVIQDPAGANFVGIELSPESAPQEWVE